MYSFTKKEQEQIFKTFKKVIDHQDPSLITDNLYNHLNINCNFDSHFSLNGFQTEYSGSEGFRQFRQYFDRNSPMSEWVEAPEISTEFAHLNHSLLDYVSERSPDHN